MAKIKTPWKATKMVKMYARGQSSSTSITRTPMIQVMPITTVRDKITFNQCLKNVQAFSIESNTQTLNHSLDFVCLFFCALSLLVSVHDNYGHYEEANVNQENQNDWSYE